MIFPRNNFFIDIIRILDNKKIISLKGHKNQILLVRHFYNSKDNFDYLLSTDDDFKLLIWDLTNNYKLKFSIVLNYSLNLSDCLIIFDENNTKDYIITSASSTHNFSKIFSFEEEGKFIKDIKSTDSNKTMNLIRWNNIKEQNSIYIIELCKNFIFVYNLYEPEIINFKLQSIIHESLFINGFIINKNDFDYLWTISYIGYINIFNLNHRRYISNIFTGLEFGFKNMIQWNSKYLITTINKKIQIIDMDQKRVINSIKPNKNYNNMFYILKIFHPYYGESLLNIEEDSTITLWTIK